MTFLILKICVTDVIWLLASFALAIVSAVCESHVSRDGDIVNVGAFASASCFAFLCVFVYLADLVFYARKFCTFTFSKKT